MSLSDSAGRGGTSSGELAGLFFPCIWEEDFQDKAWTGREEAEADGEKSSPQLCQMQAASWDPSEQLSGTGLGPGFGFDFTA